MSRRFYCYFSITLFFEKMYVILANLFLFPLRGCGKGGYDDIKNHEETKTVIIKNFEEYITID
jgi:hypothetical protein